MSIQQGNNIVLEAIVKDPNNNLLEGVPVEFYDGNTSKGESITDEYGNAKSEMFEVNDPSDLEAWACQVVNDGYVYAHDYDVSFTQDTFIGEVGSSIGVSVLVTDMNEPVNGAGVILKSNIGTTYTSNTNSSGVASFSISDLATSGKFTFEASYGSLTADCTVINARDIDYATQSKHKDIWYNLSNATWTRGDTYTELSETTSGTTAIMRQLSQYALGVGDIAEFDLYQVDGANNDNCIRIINSNNADLTGLNLNNIGDSVAVWNHLKIELTNEGIVINDNYTKSFTGTVTEKLYVGLCTNGNITKLRFKDFIIYPKPSS